MNHYKKINVNNLSHDLCWNHCVNEIECLAISITNNTCFLFNNDFKAKRQIDLQFYIKNLTVSNSNTTNRGNFDLSTSSFNLIFLIKQKNQILNL